MNREKILKPMLACLLAIITLICAAPVISYASSFPNVSGISGVSGDFERDPSVYMGSTLVAAQRYIVEIDGIRYEAYCADPMLRGPENSGAVYELSGEANSQLRNALKNGFPINTEWSALDDMNERMWWAYVTRVAVAMANYPNRAYTGESAAIDQARALANGSVIADANAYPPIMANGVKDARDTGRIIQGADAQSETFEITYNRKTSHAYNPFRFEWASGTPAGAKLVVDGNVIATAPNNASTVYRGDITSFYIEMPNTAAFRGKTATVNMVGIHNQFADRIWLMQNPNSPDTWQDIVFYIPPVAASAAFSFRTDDEPVFSPNETNVRIQKIDALTRENIPGALMRLRGISSHQVVTEDGQLWEIDNTGINLSQVLTEGATTAVPGDVVSTVTDGVWTLEGLPYGAYVVEEERAPNNYSLLPQYTAYGFWLLPPNVSVKVNQDESEAVVDIQEAIDTMLEAAIAAAIAAGQPYPNIPALLQEIRQILADMLSNVTLDVVFDIEEDDPVNSILITFENYPFGSIEVTKYDEVTGNALAGAHFRIQGYFPEGNTNGMPIDRVQVTGSDGMTVFDNLPAGQYTISEVEAPPGYQLDETAFRSISITWGQTASTSFYNKPKTFVEVVKIDGDDSSSLLDGAVFRLTDPTTGETWEGTTSDGRVRLGEGGGSFGNQLVEGKLYILTEIQAPNGYVLDSSPIEVIVSADNQLNTVTVRNFRKPTLTIQKLDELTNEPLSGATFRIWRTEGETWSETQVTGEDGKFTWADLDPGVYSIEEIDEPYGYFRDPSRKEVLLEGGDDKQLTFFNRPRPVLTILKRDQVTGEPMASVLFRVQQLEGFTIGEFVTDENGMIELSPHTGYLLSERVYRVTEVQPPAEYLLAANNVRDVLLKWFEPTELVFENLLKPTLVFMKTNGLTGRGISGATYKVEYEAHNGGIVNLGTYLTKCGLIVLPYVQPGWYILTETKAAPGYQLPTNPVQRIYLAPGQNSYAYSQTQMNLYVDPRTNPNSGNMGMCGDCCGYLCSVLCAGNCGSPGDGNMAGNNGGSFGNITITNGNGDPLGTGGTNPSNPSNPPSNPGTKPTLTAGSVTRNSNITATITFTSSIAGRFYYSVVSAGANEPAVGTGGLGTACSAGLNTVTVYLTAGARDVYIKVKDDYGNVSDALKVSVPAFEESRQSSSEPETEPPPNFDNIVITGGTVVYLNPDFPGIKITFGNE